MSPNVRYHARALTALIVFLITLKMMETLFQR